MKRTETSFAFIEDRHPPAPLTVYRSQDDGKIWKTFEVMVRKDANGNVPSMSFNEQGITLARGKHIGRLIRPARSNGTWPES
jgi:sialidase-1